MAKVLLEDITKRYDDVLAVKDTNLEIKDKEFLVLVGPSGCGKSTTLRMVAGLEEITEGKIHIGDEVVNDMPPKDRDIAMVFQNYALYPHMNVYDNMAFALKLRKMSKEKIDNRVNNAADLLGISELLERKPKHLSGGQRQRVALGRAIVREPKVFLMDEPLSNLDAKLRVQMRTELQKLHERLQTTVIYVTHDQTEAMTMGDRLVVLNHGEIQQVDTPIRLYNEPVNMFVAGFIGSPAMNFINCKLVKDNGEYVLTDGDFRLILKDEQITDKMKKLIDKDAVLGIRPEDIYDAKTDELETHAGNTTTSKVEVVEPMGSETYVYITIGGEQITAEISAESKVSVGDSIELGFNMDKVQVFDPTTEENLSLK
jgi:multiple sugar transport system ATP-binding protein